MPPQESVVLVEGPWRHRDVTANGVRFHFAEHGPTDGPLVLLLHGFPQFWWSWRHQLIALGEAGFRAVAPDLRGYGGSDKPQRGYDAYTLSADVAGLVRALGADQAMIVGHDWGGLLGWYVATLHPSVVRSLAVVSAPHPLRLWQRAVREPRGQLRALSYIAGFQLPRLAEERLVRHDAAYVGRLLHRWGGAGFPDPETERRYREALQVPGVAHSAMEWYRWAVRSRLRPDGNRFLSVLGRGVEAAVLQLHGSEDTCLLASTADGSGAWVQGPYEWRLLPGLGHFPPEEDPALVSAALLSHAQVGHGPG